ncbi:unnamed protein product [Durusdinium trenchii]|uniref:Uncharacterized protein n=1 Tax=Durusdinium trenchii TaxID=1381693 RepID=A0ABP0I3P3_9DINO
MCVCVFIYFLRPDRPVGKVEAGSTWKAEGSVNLLDCLKEWGDEQISLGRNGRLNAWTSSPSSRSFYLFGPADVGERIWNERRFDHCARLTTGDPAQKKATYQGVHHLCRFQGLILEAKPSKNIDSWVIQRPTDRVGLAPNLRCSRCFFSRTKS